MGGWGGLDNLLHVNQTKHNLVPLNSFDLMKFSCIAELFLHLEEYAYWWNMCLMWMLLSFKNLKLFFHVEILYHRFNTV
jgi:hypothetical protein